MSLFVKVSWLEKSRRFHSILPHTWLKFGSMHMKLMKILFIFADVDECRTGKDRCDVKTTDCYNIMGSYECKCNHKGLELHTFGKKCVGKQKHFFFFLWRKHCVGVTALNFSPWRDNLQRRIQDSAKHLGKNFLRKQTMAFSR